MEDKNEYQEEKIKYNKKGTQLGSFCFKFSFLH